MREPIPSGTSLRTDAARYEVLEFLWRGGMAEVYRGRNPMLDKEVAIKIQRPGSDPQRFLQEARIAAKVTSPHVVSVFDCHVLPDGSLVIIMELITGCSLADIMESGDALTTDALTLYMRDAAAGMAAVAGAGIVHRDLKPLRSRQEITLHCQIRSGGFR
jgi:eukaryotic-like serine/threonine-protein kinase